MDSQTTSQLIEILVYLLIVIVVAIIGLIIFLIIWNLKDRKKAKQEEQNDSMVNSLGTNKQSIFKFMEFDDIQDNMIIQKKGRRFLMAIKCQGINYDLMSEVEKNSVEAGFVQFLNTLREPIQIYIQTRSINLDDSIQTYKQKVSEIEDKYEKMKIRYEEMKEAGSYTDEQLNKAYYELIKQSNLREYGYSIIKDTEKMSLNKNILNQNFYIIISYSPEEFGSEKYDKEEIKNIAFSELYTKSQSIISSLMVCDVRGKILKSEELIELLYMAYNRDDAEVFGMDKIQRAGFYELYSTAPDVYKKMIKELDKKIELEATRIAQQKIEEAKTEIQQQVEYKQDNMDELIQNVAKLILEDNEKYIGKEVTEVAVKKLKETEKGGKENGNKTRGRKKTTKL